MNDRNTPVRGWTNRMPLRRAATRIARVLVGALLLCAALPVAAEDESQVRAAMVFNFARFTSWPESAFSAPSTPFTLCAAGRDGVTGALGGLQGRTLKGRQVAVRHLGGGQTANDCHLLYVAGSEQARFRALIRGVAGAPVLTVSPLPRFERSGGMIELFTERERARFLVNQGAARAAGLDISSRLLKLAQ